MKTVACLSILLASSILAQDSRPATRDFTLLDMDGNTVKYSALKGDVTAVIFFSTRCPMSNAFNYRRNTLYLDFKNRVKFIMVDSNANESIEEIRKYSRTAEFDFPVYKDLNGAAADALGAEVTTDTFVIDSLGAIRYHGYIEDSPNPTRAKIQGLRLAIQAVLDGQPVSVPETKARGCALRRNADNSL